VPPVEDASAPSLLDRPLAVPPAVPAHSAPRALPAAEGAERPPSAGPALPGPVLPATSAPLLTSPGRAALGLLASESLGLPAGVRGPQTAGGGRADAGSGAASPLGSVIGSATRGGPGAGVALGEVGALPLPRGTAEAPLAAFARPVGGYQRTPPYPETARRLGIQGTSRLRFEVLASGTVGQIVVDQSAGHPDLDRAAVDAVRQWRFEPARRGTEPVAVWVTLPVRFELR
jgi:protein TonB